MQPELGLRLRVAQFRLRAKSSEFRVGSRQVCVCVCGFSVIISTRRCPCPLFSEPLESPASLIHGRPNLPTTAKITNCTGRSLVW